MKLAPELARTLALRDPEQRYRFTLGSGPGSELHIAPIRRRVPSVSPDGLGTQPATLSGAVLVEDDFRIVFCHNSNPRELLSRVAEWAKAAAPSSGSVAALIDAGAARIAGDAISDQAIQAIDSSGLEIYRDKALWTDIARADPAAVAQILAASLPGERLWFWMTHSPGDVGMPLLLQPVSGDPNRDHLNALIDVVEQGNPGSAATGVCYATEDGSFQFIGSDLEYALVPTLANWVREGRSEHPALARLSNCRLLRTERGKVQEVIEDSSWWEGIARPAAPGTAAETETHLAALQPGKACWFWLTGTAPEGVFLSLASVADDPNGDAFGARIEGLYRRFPNSYSDAIIGVVRKADAGDIVFEAPQARVEQWTEFKRRLAERHGATAPGLATAQLVTGQGDHAVARTP